MGKQPGQALQEVIAFHAAVGRICLETGRLGVVIPIREWRGWMTKALSQQGVLLTPQACSDKTNAMHDLGLVEYIPKQGVKVLLPDKQEAPFPVQA